MITLIAFTAVLYVTQIHAFSAVPRRNALEQIQTLSIQPFIAAGASSLIPNVALAKEKINSTPISAQWAAVDGLNSLSSDKTFVSFSDSAYKAMMDDPSRTPQFERAIINRLNAAPDGPASQTVLDLGTGPYALFAIIAAKNGAGHVYAIEANPQAAKSAREAVKKMGYQDKITILEGFSTDISLPNNIKADFIVAEIVGSIASEEGAYGTVLDARRFLKDPSDANSWIPNRIQTYASPASYTLHNLFVPPAFDWGKLNGEPVRFNCRDEGLQLLSEPVLVEDIDFTNPKVVKKRDVTFTIDGGRVEKNELAFREEFKRGRLPADEVDRLSVSTARSFSGVAMWPRLLLESSTEINSRKFPDGGHQRSHWQTVLPIMNDTPVQLNGGDQVKVAFDFDVSDKVTEPAKYKISGSVVNF